MNNQKNIQTAQSNPDGYTLLGTCGFYKGQKVQVLTGIDGENGREIDGYYREGVRNCA